MIPFRQFYEQEILGLIEEVELNDLGKCKAKIDSGNEGYNVLHATDIVKKDNTVEFTTINGKRLQKPINEVIKIHIGSGITEDRFAVQFNIKIKERFFENVLFSLADRSKSDEKILIGSPFISQLNALIDVNKNKEVIQENIIHNIAIGYCYSEYDGTSSTLIKEVNLPFTLKNFQKCTRKLILRHAPDNSDSNECAPRRIIGEDYEFRPPNFALAHIVTNSNIPWSIIATPNKELTERLLLQDSITPPPWNETLSDRAKLLVGNINKFKAEDVGIATDFTEI